MSQPSHDAVIRYPLSDSMIEVVQLMTLIHSDRITSNCHHHRSTLGYYLVGYADSYKRQAMDIINETTSEWLDGTTRTDHLVSTLVSIDCRAEQLVVTWTFNDRDTALLFKLTHG